MSSALQVHDLTEKLVEPAKLLLVVGIAGVCAQATWLLLLGPLPQPDAQAVGAALNTAAAPLSLRLSGDEIAGLHLFGQATKVAAGPRLPENAPETRQPLELEGIFMSDVDPKFSTAIIAERNKPGMPYQVGDLVRPNLELAAVRPTHVILKQGTRFETLSFSDEEESGIEVTPSRAATSSRSRLGRAQRLLPEDDAADEDMEAADDAGADVADTEQITSPGDFLDAYRARLDEDPEGTLSSLGIEPVAPNSSEGYRLANVASNPYLSQAGLQPGDVIVSVNGLPVGDIQSDRQQIDNVIAAGSARIEIVRGSRRFFVTASLR